MTFNQKRGYDDEEYAPDPAATAPDEEEWDYEDEGTAAGTEAESYAADEAEGYADEGEPPPAPTRPARRAAPPPAPPQRPAAQDRAVDRGRPKPSPQGGEGRVRGESRPAPPRGYRQPPPPPPRGASRGYRGAPPPRNVRVRPAYRGAPQAGGLPVWVLPAGLGAMALLLVGVIWLVLNPPPPAPVQLNGGDMATASAKNTALAPFGAGPIYEQLTGPPGIAATVNGKPLTVGEWQLQLQQAKENYADQFGMNFDSTDVGQRMADVLGFDVLDQMINFEVLMQQAHKESIIPNPTQVQDRYNQIATQTAQQNQSWDTFLQQQHMSDQEFRQSIVDAFTYLVIAQNHTDQSKSDDEKAQQLATYICGTRDNYDVKVYVNFLVPQTPCSSAAAQPGGPPANITITPVPGQPSPVDTGEPATVAPQQQVATPTLLPSPVPTK